MNDIQFMEKPDWVSWDDVMDCIQAADTVNQKKGLHMHIAEVKPDEMKEDLKDGKCFVALCDNKVVGTTSYKIRNLRRWYRFGKVIYHDYEGIRPEFRGTDVYLNLCELKYNDVIKTGIRVLQCHTAAQNKTMIKLNLKYGFKLVFFRPNKIGLDYYSVTMVKWEDGCPFPNWYLKSIFNLSKYISKIFFTPNFKFRPSLKRL